MTKNLSRRELLQWAGLMATGVVLSPAPFAALDDLTIRTQTHGRSRSLPQGELGRLRRHCPGCPRACALEVLTVGGAPYLCVPAHDSSSALRPGCALLPALHQVALHPRRATAAVARTGFGPRPLPTSQGVDLLMDWIEDLRRDDALDRLALLDLSGRPPVGRPLDVLAGVLDGALRIERDGGYGWLDRLGHRCLLPEDLGLGIDATRVEFASPLQAMDAGSEVDAFQLASGSTTRALAVRPDGSGMRPVEDLEARVLMRARASGAIGTAFPVHRRPWSVGASLDAIADGSLSLLLVDASRAVCAVPWLRLRRKLAPDRGRLVVWSAQDGAAFRMADLGLPAPAPFDVDEIVGGDRGQPRPGLAVTAAVRRSECPDCGPEVIAARIGAEVMPASRRLAEALVHAGSGEVEFVDDAPVPLSKFDVVELERVLDAGAVWRAEPVELDVADRAGGSLPPARPRAPWIAFEGAPVVAAGEPVPPALSKVTREFATHRCEGTARVHPDTLADLGMRDGARHQFRTARGSVALLVRADASAPRGVVIAALGFGGDCFGDDAPRRREQPLLSVLDFDPQLDPPDACAVQEVM